jgi:rhodanese-related sulfurtransferase
MTAETGAAARRVVYTLDDLLTEARASLPPRSSPADALAAQAMGALLIDIRGDDQRRDCGVIPGALLLPRNSLEWRCDPASQWRHPAITSRDLHLILVCQQGYQSSLAAATLQRLGLVKVTDMDGGFEAWAAAGLPVIAKPTTGQPFGPPSLSAAISRSALPRLLGLRREELQGRRRGLSVRPED